MEHNLKDLLLYVATRVDLTREKKEDEIEDVVFEIQDRLRHICQLTRRVSMLAGDVVDMEVFDLELALDSLIEDLS